MSTLRDLKITIEERFHDKWTSLSVQYHFKLMASHLLKVDFSEVNFHLNHAVSTEQKMTFENWLDQLWTEKPIQYILGETEFRGLRFFCSPSALIPRPETEELVELIVTEFNTSAELKILDLCTGTGCIAICLQKELKKSKVIALDYFEDVIALAQLNNAENSTSVNFEIVNVLSESEMRKYGTEDYDIWVSNPPYIPEKEKIEMSANVLDYEPPAALFVEDLDPLIFYRQIAANAQKGLKSGGQLFFEIHENFGQETIALLQSLDFVNVDLHKDLQGKERMISAQKK